MIVYDLHNLNENNLLVAMNDEWMEFIQANTLAEKIFEWNDYMHTFIKFNGYKYHIPAILIYTICFIFAPYTSIKHGLRYYHHGCIRNLHHCQKIGKDHCCINR